MQKDNRKYEYKIFTTVFPVFIFAFLIPGSVGAASLETTPRSDPLRINEEFVVPVRLSADTTTPINAFSISILYPTDIVQFIGSDENNSIVPLWVQKPKEENGHITLEGAIPGGFTEVLDPLTQIYSPGLVTTLIFKPIKSGVGYIRSGNIALYLNDGTGKSITGSGLSFPFTVTNEVFDSPYLYNDTTSPQPFTITLQKSDLLFDGEYFIVFSAIDKDSGIDHYEIREGSSSWVKGDSPYRLKDQSLSVDVRVKAVDKGGNDTIALLPATNPKEFSAATFIPILIILFLIFSLILTRKTRKRKNSGIQ